MPVSLWAQAGVACGDAAVEVVKLKGRLTYLGRAPAIARCIARKVHINQVGSSTFTLR